MKAAFHVLLLLSVTAQAVELSRIKNVELARTLSFLMELARQDGIRIFSVPAAEGECWGKIESCPEVMLYVVVSPEALYQEPTLYQLPASKGWTFVRWEKSGSFVLRTMIPDANIEAAEREKWRSAEYLVTITGNGASYEKR